MIIIQLQRKSRPGNHMRRMHDLTQVKISTRPFIIPRRPRLGLQNLLLYHIMDQQTTESSSQILCLRPWRPPPHPRGLLINGPLSLPRFQALGRQTKEASLITLRLPPHHPRTWRTGMQCFRRPLHRFLRTRVPTRLGLLRLRPSKTHRTETTQTRAPRLLKELLKIFPN